MKPLVSRQFVLFLLCTCLVHVAAAADDSPASGSDSTRPNIVVVLIDTLRTAFLPIYGYPDDTMPFVNKLAEDAAVFNRAFSTSSWTAPSVASLFTSTYPSNHGMKIGMAARRREMRQVRESGSMKISMQALPKRLTTLPEALKEHGYSTFSVASNLNISTERGFDRGFDQFASMNRMKAELLVERMHEWKSEIDGDKPFFLYFHFNDCHLPYQKIKPYYVRTGHPIDDARSAYTSVFPYVDSQIQAIHEAFVRDQNTIFVIVSDHGEEFREHGGLLHEGTLYDELNRVIALFSGPEKYVTPGRIDENISLIDIMPTLLEMVDAPIEEQSEGVSLLPILRAGESANALRQTLVKRILFAERSHPKNHDMELRAAIQGPWKLIDKWGERMELYNHDRDPQEQNNAFADHLRKVKTLQAAIASEIRRSASNEKLREPEQEITMDDELLDQLEALGYVQ